LDNALRAYAVNGAYASFEEQRKGTLRPGLLGDVTVFETDLFAVDPNNLAKINVDYTISEGKVVYER
jgi:predicted amidohydrolase YtcJ